MSLPLSRNFDASDAGPLDAATVNDLQDGIIFAKHGQLFRMLSTWDAFLLVGGVFTVPPVLAHDGGGVNIVMLAMKGLPSGTRVLEAKAYVLNNAADDVTVQPFRYDASVSALASITPAKSDGGTGAQEVEFTDVDAGWPFTILDQNHYYFEVRLAAGGLNTALKGIRLSIDKP